MIELPRRSVTRFFIPLIDVLLLLFAIFVMLPVQNERRVITSAEEKKKAEDDLEKMQAKLNEMAQRAGDDEIARLQKQINELPKKLIERELTIDPENGDLYYLERGADPLKIDSQARARALVEVLQGELDQRKKSERLRIIIRSHPPFFYPSASDRDKYVLSYFNDVPGGVAIVRAPPQLQRR